MLEVDLCQKYFWSNIFWFEINKNIVKMVCLKKISKLTKLIDKKINFFGQVWEFQKDK